MMWSDYITMDPSDLEAKFSIEDSMSYFDSIFDEPDSEDLDTINDIKSKLEILPAIEADFLDLYYFQKLKQTQIAAIFHVSQPTVCYRLQRAAARLHFLLKVPPLDQEELKKDLTVFLPDELDFQVMTLLPKTACQSDVARLLKVSQGLVRHRYLRSIDRMCQFASFLREDTEDPRILSLFKDLVLWKDREQLIEDFSQYICHYKFLATNLNILRELHKSPLDDQEPVYEVVL